MNASQWRYAAITTVVGFVLMGFGTFASFQWARNCGELLPTDQWGFHEYPYTLMIRGADGRTKMVHLGVTNDIGCFRFTRLDPPKKRVP